MRHGVEVATGDLRWTALLDAGHGTLFHSSTWAGVLADAYGIDTKVLLAVDGAGRTIGGLPCSEVVGPGGPRLVAVPFADACDPLLGSPQAWDALRAMLTRSCLPVQLRVTSSPEVVDDPALRVLSTARHHRLALGDDPDELHRSFSSACRRAIRRAQRSGVVVERPDDDEFLDEFLRLHVALRKRKYGLLAQPRRFLEAIRDRTRAEDGWLPLVARHQGRVVAATLLLRWRHQLVYKFNASDPAALAVRPNNLLMWSAVQLGCELGCEHFDLGASDDDQPGLVRFKRSFGATEGQITRLRFDPPGWDDRAERATAALLGDVTRLLVDPLVPDELTRAAGDALYRYFA